MLAVDDQERLLGLRQIADPLVVAEWFELELLAGEQQHRAGNHRLARLVAVEVADLPYLPADQRALERLRAALDRLDEALDGVGELFPVRVAADRCAALAVEPGDEMDLAQQVFGRVADEVELRLLLTHPQGEHDDLSSNAVGFAVERPASLAPGPATTARELAELEAAAGDTGAPSAGATARRAGPAVFRLR